MLTQPITSFFLIFRTLLSLVIITFFVSLQGMGSQENTPPNTPPKVLGKHSENLFKTPPPPSKRSKQSPSSNQSPSGIDLLTSPFGHLGCKTPFGVKTPKKYIDSTSPLDVLDLFASNFLRYNNESSLTSLIHFLFTLDNNGKLQRKQDIIDQQRDPKNLFPQFLWAEFNTATFFEKAYAVQILQQFHLSLKTCKSPNDKENLKQDCLARINAITQALQHDCDDCDAKNLLIEREVLQNVVNNFPKKYQKIDALKEIKKAVQQDLDRILEERYRFANCGNSCSTDLTQKRCKNCAKFTLSSQQKKWVEKLADCLYKIQSDASQKNRYQKIASYLIAFYLHQWHTPVQIKIKKNLMDLFNATHEQTQAHTSSFDVLSAALEALQKNGSTSCCSNLLPYNTRQFGTVNTELITNCLEESPLYYLLCFNIHHQEIKEQLDNICNGRYEAVTTAENTKMLRILVHNLLHDYTNTLTSSTPESFSKAHYAKELLVDTFNRIKTFLLQDKEDVMATENRLLLCPFLFKGLLEIASIINVELELHDSDIQTMLIINQSHIERLVFEQNEQKKTLELRGGHLCCTQYIITNGNEEFSVDNGCMLVQNNATGVAIGDWFLYNKNGDYSDHKSSTLFPACYNNTFRKYYVQRLLSTLTTPDDEVTCYESSNHVQEKDGGSKRIVIFKHNHAVGCAQQNSCKYSAHSELYVMAILKQEPVCSQTQKNCSLNSVISLYPLAACCLEFTKERGFVFENTALSTDNELQQVLPVFFDYQRHEIVDKGLIYDAQNRPLYQQKTVSYDDLYQALLQAAAALTQKNSRKKIANNIDASIIQITDPSSQEQIVLVKAFSGIIIKIPYEQLITLS